MDKFSVVRQIKRLENKYGIEKNNAKFIVDDVSDIMILMGSKCPMEFEKLINYAVDLVYRLGISKGHDKAK